MKIKYEEIIAGTYRLHINISAVKDCSGNPYFIGRGFYYYTIL